MHQTLNISQGCQPEHICMTNFPHRHSAPYWEQEVNLLVKLDCHFLVVVVSHTVRSVTTCFFPDCGTPRWVRVCEGPLNAACSFNFICYYRLMAILIDCYNKYTGAQLSSRRNHISSFLSSVLTNTPSCLLPKSYTN